MSFLKRLFGGGSGENPREALAKAEFEGYRIQATPVPEGGQYRLCALISKEIDGTVREHTLIRADMFPSADQAAEASLAKAKRLIEEQGEGLFR